MSLALAVLKKGEGRTLKAGGAWIFDNEIDSVTGAFENGDVVMVHDFDGYPMGRGFINMHSKIRIRMLTRNPDQEIDEEFFRERLRDAWEYRKKTERRISFRGWWWTSFRTCSSSSVWLLGWTGTRKSFSLC